jgi:5-methylcytosine-specific restriction protein A
MGVVPGFTRQVVLPPLKSEFEEAVEAAAKLPPSERKLILQAESKTPELTVITTRVYKRSPCVVAEVLLANGKCQKL